MSSSTTSSDPERAAHRRYLLRLILVTGLALALIGLGNALIDPFRSSGVGLARFEGHRAGLHTRVAKGALLARPDCRLFLLGSSRVEAGFDPERPALAPLDVCNAGLAGTNLVEVAAVLRRLIALREAGLLDDEAQVALFVDFLAFSDRRSTSFDFASSRLDPERDPLEHTLAQLFGLAATEASIETLALWRAGTPAVMTERGHHRLQDQGLPPRALFDKRLRSFVRNRETYGAYRYDPERVTLLATVLAEARAAGLPVRVAIAPVHALQLELIAALGLRPVWATWRSDLAAAVDDDAHPLLDFTGYRPWQQQTVPAGEERTPVPDWLESSHFRPAMGDRLLAALLEPGGAEARALAQRLSRADSERQDRLLVRARSLWRQQNPDEARWVAQLVSEERPAESE